MAESYTIILSLQTFYVTNWLMAEVEKVKKGEKFLHKKVDLLLCNQFIVVFFIDRGSKE